MNTAAPPWPKWLPDRRVSRRVSLGLPQPASTSDELINTRRIDFVARPDSVPSRRFRCFVRAMPGALHAAHQVRKEGREL
jgi:hypothetical protein